MMTPWGRNMYRSELFYKLVFDGYLFIPYFIVQHNGTHNLLKIKKINILSRVRQYWTLIDGSPAHISIPILQEIEWAEVFNSSRERHSFIAEETYSSFFIRFCMLEIKRRYINKRKRSN
jgi:hypothetical protein